MTDLKAEMRFLNCSLCIYCVFCSVELYFFFHSTFPSQGFTQVSTETGEPPVNIIPNEEPDPIQTFSLKKEAADVRCVNEIVMQFLAYS